MSEKLIEQPFLAKMKPVEISDSAFALALIGTNEAQGPLMLAMAARVTTEDLLLKFTSRQLVTLTWALARMKTRPQQLEDWVERIKEQHAQTPLLAQDQRNVEVALSSFGVESSSWLKPEAVEADDDAK
jgi:hypothetical protein